MKPRLPDFSPASRIALGLVSLIVTLLLLIDIAFNLVPDQTDMHRRIRERISEQLAVQITSLIQTQEWDALKLTINAALERDPEVLSVAVRRLDGGVVVMAGNHSQHWVAPAPGRSTLTHVRVPVYAHDGHWGDVEISYKPVTPQSLREWLQMPLVALFAIIVPAGFLAFYLYMRRSLQYLDPTSAIPDRVRVAFDALIEGVAVIDHAGRIMLHNKAFCQLHPFASQDMLGKPLSQLPWLVGGQSSMPTPWEEAMQSRTNASGHLLTITQPDESIIKVIVNASPIVDAQGKLRGCMVTFYDVTELHRANETMSQTLAALEASREQVEKQNEELMRLATRDSLTGCLNRRAFFAAGEPLFEKLHLEARSITCVMADIDHFKSVNDTYGHATGDQVIVAVANCLSRHMRAGDLLCRYGGEEFCILLAGTGEDAAMEIAERLRHEIEQQVGRGLRNVEGLHITSSFGVVGMRSGAESLSELIELADFALYNSKRNGRNRVTLWSDSLGSDLAAAGEPPPLLQQRPGSNAA